jgi:hypothetical protein
MTMLAIIASFTAGAIFGAVGVVLLAKRAAVRHMVPDKPGPDYYDYLRSLNRIEPRDPHAAPYGDA